MRIADFGLRIRADALLQSAIINPQSAIVSVLSAHVVVDVVELGVPFTDPLADGPTIQRAAEKALKEGYALLDSGEPVVPFGIYLRLARADVALIRGENDRAVELAATIISDLESLHLRFGLNRARILLARSRHAQGKSQEALTILEEARIGAESSKSCWDLWQVYALQGEIASQINPKSALGYFESARKQINMILLHIPTTGPNASLRESFSSLPLVRSVLEQTR